jgi:hypothetical protein
LKTFLEVSFGKSYALFRNEPSTVTAAAMSEAYIRGVPTCAAVASVKPNSSNLSTASPEQFPIPTTLCASPTAEIAMTLSFVA